jgi:hypothetical protein
MIIISGILQENPFIVSSDEFLRGLRERRARIGLGSRVSRLSGG